jgi:hypothetical protein
VPSIAFHELTQTTNPLSDPGPRRSHHFVSSRTLLSLAHSPSHTPCETADAGLPALPRKRRLLLPHRTTSTYARLSWQAGCLATISLVWGPTCYHAHANTVLILYPGVLVWRTAEHGVLPTRVRSDVSALSKSHSLAQTNPVYLPAWLALPLPGSRLDTEKRHKDLFPFTEMCWGLSLVRSLYPVSFLLSSHH